MFRGVPAEEAHATTAGRGATLKYLAPYMNDNNGGMEIVIGLYVCTRFDMSEDQDLLQINMEARLRLCRPWAVIKQRPGGCSVTRT